MVRGKESFIGGLVLLGRHQTRRFNLNDCATASKE
eukprot:g40240.t1